VVWLCTKCYFHFIETFPNWLKYLLFSQNNIKKTLNVYHSLTVIMCRQKLYNDFKKNRQRINHLPLIFLLLLCCNRQRNDQILTVCWKQCILVVSSLIFEEKVFVSFSFKRIWKDISNETNREINKVWQNIWRMHCLTICVKK
jgi:hypothetical protein